MDTAITIGHPATLAASNTWRLWIMWCGTMFAMDLYGVTPDIFAIGKALGNGFLISGTVISEKLKGFQAGNDENFTGTSPSRRCIRPKLPSTVPKDATRSLFPIPSPERF